LTVKREEAVAFKEWAGVVGTVTGVLALLISGLNAYYNIIRQKDELRVANDGRLFASTNADGVLEITGRHSLTFINSGNRAAAVTSIKLLVSELDNFDDKEAPNCLAGRGVYLDYEIEPFAVKPGEIFVKSLDVKGEAATFKIIFGTERKYLLMTCLEFSVASPDEFRGLLRPLTIEEFGKPKGKRTLGEGFGDSKITLGLSRPEILMQRSGFQSMW
jgi:hypothetical protein